MAVRVKPLVWQEPCERNNYCHIARTMLGDYYVHIDGGRHQAFLEAHVKPFEHLIGNVVGDIWAAKAAAQADYEARILAALEPAPAPVLVADGVLSNDEIAAMIEEGPGRIVQAPPAPAPDMAELVEALRWYGEQSRLARLIHSEGDAGRHAISADGGKRAFAVLALITEKQQ